MDLQLVNHIKSLKGKIPDSDVRKEICRVFNVKKTCGNKIFHNLFDTAHATNKPVDSCGIKMIKTEGQKEVNVSLETEETATLEDVIKFCDVDSKVWESKGFSVSKGPHGLRWSARFAKRINVLDPKVILDDFIKRASENAPRFVVKPIPQNKDRENLLEISVPDLHLAKLCWGRETGGRDYDIKIAAQDYKNAVRTLYARSKGRVNRVLLPVGNDMFNSDNLNGTTTKGTPQATSEDSRWPKTFQAGCDILIEMITELAQEVFVDVVIVAGNHDKERSFYLGAVLSAWFRNHAHVKINNEPTQRKYFRFGTTLLGFTHGSEEKKEKLPGIMAREAKQHWSECKFYQWHLGHVHHEVTHDYEGVVVRFLTSLCPPDEWHASKGYVGSVQAAEAFEYHQTDGLLSVFYYNV